MKHFKAGDTAAAKKAFMSWVTPPEIKARRQKECDLSPNYERTARAILHVYRSSLARVGLSEGEARANKMRARVAKLPMKAVLRTQTTSETTGFMKALVGADDRLVGFTMVGSEAGEVMTIVQTAMMARLPYTALRDAILTHPHNGARLNALLAMCRLEPKMTTKATVPGKTS